MPVAVVLVFKMRCAPTSMIWPADKLVSTAVPPPTRLMLTLPAPVT
jgi:hypothetical protein